MALGGIILYMQFQNASGTAGAASSLGTIIHSIDEYSLEFRVRFPSSTNTVMAPTELSGALVTLSSGNLPSSYLSLWYEKSSADSTTGAIYLTSSAGRLSVDSTPIFDDEFYNLSIVRERSTGSISLFITRHDGLELAYATSSVALTGTVGCPPPADFIQLELGSSQLLPSRAQFWGQEFRLWRAPLDLLEIYDHSENFESYGRDVSYNNKDLYIHWRLNEGRSSNSTGTFYVVDSTLNHIDGTGSFFANSTPYKKFLETYAYIPSYDYGWNQKKIRTYNSSSIDDDEIYHDERFVSLELNMIDALNEDISHLMSSYDELNNFIGLPVNKYRVDYEGLRQMRETYFKRLQGRLNFRLFADMLDYFDRSFVDIIKQMIPARSLFKGDEFIVESHMLERPKYVYGARPVQEPAFVVSGSIRMIDR